MQQISILFDSVLYYPQLAGVMFVYICVRTEDAWTYTRPKANVNKC